MTVFTSRSGWLHILRRESSSDAFGQTVKRAFCGYETMDRYFSRETESGLFVCKHCKAIYAHYQRKDALNAIQMREV